MSKYIHADELIKWIRETQHQTTKMKNIICKIEAMPTIDIPTWIPCSERLPERQGYYICTCKDGSNYKRTTPIKWSNGWQMTGARAYWLVIAWMPLPQPHKAERSE